MKKFFFTGLAILLPLAFTFLVVKFIVDFLTMPFLGVMQETLGKVPFFERSFWIFSSQQVLLYLSRILILVSLLAFTILLGMLGRWFFLRSIFQIAELVLDRIPLVNKIYKASREVFRTLLSSSNNSFKEVVLIPFPSSEGRTLGFISGDAPDICSEHMGEPCVSVFVPTTPNPTSGFLMMFKKSEVESVPMKVDEAIRFIISCGVLKEQKSKSSCLPPKS